MPRYLEQPQSELPWVAECIADLHSRAHAPAVGKARQRRSSIPNPPADWVAVPGAVIQCAVKRFLWGWSRPHNTFQVSALGTTGLWFRNFSESLDPGRQVRLVISVPRRKSITVTGTVEWNRPQPAVVRNGMTSCVDICCVKFKDYEGNAWSELREIKIRHTPTA